MPGKEKHNYVALVAFSFCTYGDNEMKHFSTEKVQKQSIRSQNSLEIVLKRFSEIAIRENS